LKKLGHLAEIYKAYDTFIIDLWGVMHNGIRLNNEAIKAVDNLSTNNKKVIFLSNAPRPKKNVMNFLRKINMNEKYLKNVFTSGEAAINSLRNKKFGDNFFHLGPKRDSALFEGFKEKSTNIDLCDFILCTGLFDEHTEDLIYYKNLLSSSVSKKLVCTNPDLVVHRGNKEEYCAGIIAKIFEELGGDVVYFGKPYKEIYDMILDKEEKALVIGDNLNTDIKGANNLKIDALFITSGVHRSEFEEEKELVELLKKYNVSTKFFQKNLTW
tara:strand:+ start:2142 stop:2948 length:807 start_codon:yes stop_codon:yes gene_type:complete